MPDNQPISEDELHAYVDGDIAPGRRLDIALYLARHPVEAARVEVFRAQREAIRALFDDLVDQPVPWRLRSIVRRHARRRTQRRRRTGMVIGVAAATIVLVTGRTVVHYAAPEHGGPAAEAAAQHAPAADELPAIRPLDQRGRQNRNFDI